jgi:L-fuconolactonase
MKIDAHQHFWALTRGDYGWLTPDLAPIYRDFLPADLAPLLAAAGIDGTVIVQAAPTEAETLFMLELAEANDFVKGVVGWTDFEAADAPQRIAEMAKSRWLVGFRPMIQDIADPGWMLDKTLAPAFEALIAAGLRFDALTKPRHLKNLLVLLQRYPDMKTVIDHGSKPDIAGGTSDQWAVYMAAIARETNACCKLSGLVTEAASQWTVDDLRPYVSHLIETFGPERLIWGSDWPVCTLAASYAEWTEATAELLSGLTKPEIDAIMGGNAIRFYGLK